MRVASGVVILIELTAVVHSIFREITGAGQSSLLYSAAVITPHDSMYYSEDYKYKKSGTLQYLLAESPTLCCI